MDTPAMDTTVRMHPAIIVAALNLGTGNTITVAPTRRPGTVRLLTTVIATVPGKIATLMKIP